MFPRVITQSVKNKVYEATEEAFEIDGRLETERVRALLEENFGICFFNTAELEKLIKESLDKQVFAYKSKGEVQDNPVRKSIGITGTKKQGILIQFKSIATSKEDIDQAIEQLREKMNISIELNGRESNSTLELSQKLDILIVASMRNCL